MTDEFFTENPIPTGLVEFDQLTVPKRVARKQQFEELALSLNGALLEENSALEAFLRIKNVAEILEVALGQIKARALSEIEGRTQEVLGVTVQLKSLPKKWEYDDSELHWLEGERAAIEARLKERKKFLETLKNEIADTRTGEIIRPARCISEGATIQVLF
jgi:hypothetical protein